MMAKRCPFWFRAGRMRARAKCCASYQPYVTHSLCTGLNSIGLGVIYYAKRRAQ